MDLDRDQLLWAKEHNVEADAGCAERVKLICRNVLELDEGGKDTGKSDVICAFNFSICYLFDRNDLVKYFKICHGTLKSDGIFFCDIFGGETSIKPDVTRRNLSNGVKYEFQQVDYCPITNRSHFQMTFKFPDGSKLKEAFEYYFRIWTIPEIREALRDAGFSKTTVWFLDQSEDAPEDGTYEPTEATHQRESWHAFIVALV